MYAFVRFYRASDGGVFLDSPLRDLLEDETLGVPEHTPLPHDDHPIPYHIIADEAFALKPWLMKPYPQRNMTVQMRIYNYRLSRARRMVENAFGVLSHR